MLEFLPIPMASLLHSRCPSFPKQAFVFAFAAAVLMRPVLAGAELDLIMDDPSSLLRSHPEGLSRLPAAFASSKATIASGVGGRAVPQFSGSPDAESQDAKVQILSEPALGSKPFFRATLNGASPVKQVGLGILPDKEASLQNLAKRENGHVKISGAIDFLIRGSSSSGSPKFQLNTKVANLGVTVTTAPKDGVLVLKIYTSAKSLSVNSDKTGKRSAIEKRSESRLDNDSIYHGALIFKTQADGSQTVSLCIAPGAGPLDPAATAAAVIDGFEILEDASSKEVDKIAINLGRDETSQQTLDIAAFRTFQSPLETLPAFEAKQP